MRKIFLFICTSLFIIFSISLFVAPIHAQPTISYTSKITGLTAPVDVVDAKDGSGRLFIVQQNGLIRVWNGSTLLAAPFLDISSIIIFTGDERGLLSMVFHPAYTTNGYFLFITILIIAVLMLLLLTLHVTR